MIQLAKLKTILIRTFGAKFTGLIHGFRFAYLILRKRKTDPEMLYLDAQIQKGDVCVDVGANSADWSSYFSRRVGKTGEIFSFEADPYYAHATRAACRILLLRNVRFFDFGLSDKEEAVHLNVADEFGVLLSGTQRISQAQGKSPDNRKTTVAIALRRLDSLTSAYPALFKVKFMKIDVEGYELFVLRGSECILKQARPVIVLERGEYEDHGYSAVDLDAYLSSLGYLGFALTSGGALNRINANMECLDAVGSNCVYLPKERHEQRPAD